MTRLLRRIRQVFARSSPPRFDAVLREALDEPLLLLSPQALERSLTAPASPFHPQPQ